MTEAIEKKGFIHHVFFWLKNPESKEALQQLVKGLERLSGISEILEFQIGIPAKTNRPVIDNSYSISWLLLFDNAYDQEVYQTHPVHLKFIDECSHLWEKVTVYDSVNLVF